MHEGEAMKKGQSGAGGQVKEGRRREGQNKGKEGAWGER